MSTLTYSRTDLATEGVTAEAVERPRRRTIWRRLFDGMIASQQRRADREIAAWLNSHGGTMTDEMEREIMERIAGRRRSSV
jgi:hypothetical protein